LIEINNPPAGETFWKIEFETVMVLALDDVNKEPVMSSTSQFVMVATEFAAIVKRFVDVILLKVL